MNIEQIFAKPLSRDINGVVKAEQTDQASVWVELDEYVITKELDKHFKAFFAVYTPTIRHANSANASKIGVWVSGFFGSGKSHFIKILSYLLENRQVSHLGESKQALDFFKDKISDAKLWADIQVSVQHPTDVILFNIDSRANTDDQENAILKVFLKVFNERIGYCADFPHIAHLERELDKRQQYAAFQAKFAELTGSTWHTERDAYDFFRDEMVEALAHASAQSLESARQWMDSLEQHFPLDIRNFCKWVNEYIEQSGQRNVLFLVDEVGQFIGKNSQMMLKLQTITEDLGTYCHGRAWVIVTSQADIDAAIGGMDKRDGDDFSKIQGRFITRLQLSSSNTAEVIQKRLLEKTAAATQTLTAMYAQSGDILRNQLSFDRNTTATLKNYPDADSFVANYPFIPYHYLLLQRVFESIRTKGATGKHLAMGERSLLDAFQSAAKQIKQQDLSVLVPFYRFYAPIEGFLEPAVKRTIDQACDSDSLDQFDGNILKTLFLVRYVEELKSTLDNLVTLSVAQIDHDKIELRQQIEQSLDRLERQLLIARNGDEYVFLTNEEKEIENEIRRTEVEPSEQSNRLSMLIFDDVLRRQTSYRYPVNKQDFKLSRFCNGHPKDGSQQEDLVIKLVSPLDAHFSSTYAHEQQCLNESLQDKGCVLIKLSDHPRLWDELTLWIRTDRFIKQNSGLRLEQATLMREKSAENDERGKRLKHAFEALWLEAPIYAIGQRLTLSGSSATSRLDDACQHVIENTFSKLTLLKPTSGDLGREISATLNATHLAQIGLDLQSPAANPLASREVQLYISIKNTNNEAIYVRELLQHFARRPYGWLENETLLLVARLALSNQINLTIQGAVLPLSQAYEPLMSVRKRAEIRIQPNRQHEERQLKAAAQLHKDLFGKSASAQREKDLAVALRVGFSRWLEQLKAFRATAQTGQFPAKTQIAQNIVTVAQLLEIQGSYDLIEQLLKQQDDWLDFAEDFESLADFYESQLPIWQALTVALQQQFSANRPALDKDPTAHDALQHLATIYALDRPFEQLKRVQPLIDQVQAVNQRLVAEKREHALQRLSTRLERIQAALSAAAAPAEICNKALYPLRQLQTSIEQTLSIPQILSEQGEAENAEQAASELVNQYIERLRQQHAATLKKTPPVTPPPTTPTGAGSSTPAVPNPTPSVATPMPRFKRTITVYPVQVRVDTTGSPMLDNEADVEAYVRSLREQLLNVVRAGDAVRLADR